MFFACMRTTDHPDISSARYLLGYTSNYKATEKKVEYITQQSFYRNLFRPCAQDKNLSYFHSNFHFSTKILHEQTL